ncbi:DUF2799 domain-containing protein [bacterium]|nr:DUF2799 domain-containing protein [bacterium]NBX83030.1 DUF2799 domain-containing protein [bacterium]
MKRFLLGLGFLSTFLMFSCATLNEQQCKTGNWEEIGRQDGLRGFSASRVAAHSKACQEHGVQVNNASYQKGYDSGVREFCAPANGYQMGKAGMVGSQATCPADMAAAFSSAMQKGYADYQAELVAREAERKARELAAVRASFFNLSPRGGVCDAAESVGVCFVFAGDNYTKPDSARGNQLMCKLFNGQFHPIGNCPEPKVLGRCDLVQGSPDAYSLFYYQTRNVDYSAATKDCADPKSSLHNQGAGQWVGVPG